jgi:hypothetical protein
LRETIREIRYWTSCLLLVLAVTGAAWTLATGRAGPLWAALAYGVVGFLVLRREEYRAGLVVGLAGFILHLVKLLGGAMSELGGSERLLFLGHLALPIVVAGLSWRAIRVRGRQRASPGPVTGAC